jgi:predicted metallo-beta-lactamase superfamily hydrolase
VSPLIDLYNETINGEVDQVELSPMEEEFHPLTQSSKEILTEAADIYFEMFEEFEHEHHKEAFGAYYIYDYDTDSNIYSIGVLGN